MIHLLQMLEETLKVSLFVDRVDNWLLHIRAIDLPFPHQVLSLANSADNPSETPLSTYLEDRTILTKTDSFEGLG